MTLSLTAYDAATGAFGVIISSSSPAVASRCVHLRPGVGAVASQNVTNPALGPAALTALSAAVTPEEAIAHALRGDDYPEYRQVTAVDRAGRIAVHSGAKSLGIFGSVEGRAAIAAGNMLRDGGVLPALVAGYESAEGVFERRLLAGLRAAVDAGGEAGPLRSAGLSVVEKASWRVTDLRVDDHDDPIGELARLVELWLPQKADYLTRALDPTAAPSYGVSGDE